MLKKQIFMFIKYIKLWNYYYKEYIIAKNIVLDIYMILQMVIKNSYVIQ